MGAKTSEWWTPAASKQNRHEYEVFKRTHCQAGVERHRTTWARDDLQARAWFRAVHAAVQMAGALLAASMSLMAISAPGSYNVTMAKLSATSYTESTTRFHDVRISSHVRAHTP